MPRKVNREERIAEIHEAVLRLIVQSGVPAASLRNVAHESGVNVGSVRHYIGSHEEMLRGAATRMWERTAMRLSERVRKFDAEATDAELREFVVELLEELIPLDEQRRDETAVWLSLQDYGRVDPEIGVLARDASDGIRKLTGELLQSSAGSTSVAADALAAVVDGLAVAAMSNPQRYTRRRVRAILRWQVEQATRPERG